jgi:hypothetical protein
MQVFDRIETELKSLQDIGERRTPAAFAQLLQALEGGVKEQQIVCLHCKTVSSREEHSSEHSRWQKNGVSHLSDHSLL